MCFDWDDLRLIRHVPYAPYEADDRAGEYDRLQRLGDRIGALLPPHAGLGGCLRCAATAVPDPEDGCCVILKHADWCTRDENARRRPRRKRRRARSPEQQTENLSDTSEGGSHE